MAGTEALFWEGGCRDGRRTKEGEPIYDLRMGKGVGSRGKAESCEVAAPLAARADEGVDGFWLMVDRGKAPEVRVATGSASRIANRKWGGTGGVDG